MNPTVITIDLSGGDVIGAAGLPPNTIVTIRQFHRDFQTGDREYDYDENDARFEIIDPFFVDAETGRRGGGS